MIQILNNTIIDRKRFIIKVPIGNKYKWYQFCTKKRAQRLSKEKIRNYINMIKNDNIVFPTNEKEIFIPVK